MKNFIILKRKKHDIQRIVSRYELLIKCEETINYDRLDYNHQYFTFNSDIYFKSSLVLGSDVLLESFFNDDDWYLKQVFRELYKIRVSKINYV